MEETEQKQATSIATPQTVNLKELSLDRLKALAYDRILIIEQTQLELRAIQEEINKRGKS